MHGTLTVAQASRLLHIPEETIRRLVKFDEIPHRKRGGEPLFLHADLDAWASRRLLALQQRPLAEEHARASADAASAKDAPLIPALLTPARITLTLPSRTHHAVLRDMVTLATQTDCLYDPADLLRQLEEREAAASTALPGGIALLHPHHQDPYLISEPFMVIGIAPHPIYFGAPDNTPTDIFTLLCCGEPRHHLHTLSRLILMVRGTTLLDDLRAAETPQAAFDALCTAEQNIIATVK